MCRAGVLCGRRGECVCRTGVLRDSRGGGVSRSLGMCAGAAHSALAGESLWLKWRVCVGVGAH